MAGSGLDRRTLIAGTAAVAAVGGTDGRAAPPAAPRYGLIGRFRAKPGQRDALAQALLAGSGAMPGCLSYIVAHDPTDPDALWVTEAWDSKASHAASLNLPAVRAAIARGRPLIAGMDSMHETVPVGGVGLAPAGA